MPPKRDVNIYSRSHRNLSQTVNVSIKPKGSVDHSDIDAATPKRKVEEAPPLIVEGSRKRKPSRRLLESNIAQSVSVRAHNHKVKCARVDSSSDELDVVVDETSRHTLPSFSASEEDSDNIQSSDSDVERNSDGVPMELIRRQEVTTTDVASSKTKESLRLTSDTVYLEDVVSPSFIPPTNDETRV
ncbi:hypothetical protein JVT61DRAFT_186 [Boletus reticuloceps]|uniref:Uncharacterized protein n=1 Tax=Boletus reticuloceps TaxID=495285 RepID=A0A8I2YYA0_9AGAM|nr:hypothetical protein JVT61DRAFT_186 [Boletus reticuloceps]